MATMDKSGRPYAKLSEVKEGDTLVTDDGFECMGEGETKQVAKDEDGLYVTCTEGHHYLDGQDDGDGCLIGLYKS